MRTMLVLSLTIALGACADAPALDTPDAGTSAEARSKVGTFAACYAETQHWQLWLGQFCLVQRCCSGSFLPITLSCYTARVEGVSCQHR